MMERPERMPAPAIQSTIRGLPDNPGQGRRPVPNSAATSNGPTAAPPVPSLRSVPSNPALPSVNSMPASQVIALAQEAMRSALESETQAEVAAVGPALKAGVTVDLSRKNIQKLPEEVVDIVKHELERLALSHNQLSALPARFSECTSLRYLNIRGNQIREFPMALCDLKSLEILDLGRNQLRALPQEIVKLTSLKVLSVPKNQIRELPTCLAEIGSLQVLKFEGNPIKFPPKEALQLPYGSPPNEIIGRDSEKNDVTVTAHIKKFLKQHSLNGRIESDATGDESSEAGEAQRLPLKRRISGRFPIKINGADVSDARSPNLGRPPPPIPNRSHYRGLSQQTAAIRRPSVLPLTMSSVNERSRSNSESVMRSDRSESRNRRMGIVPKKQTDLGTLDETEVNNRFSHNRGLSHGSAMQGVPVGSDSPATPTEPFLQRPVYVRRLSVLPERRPESEVFDPTIEAAKGILYSVFQIHPMIQMLMSLTSDGQAKRSSLERVFYNTNSHVEELEQELQKYDATPHGSETGGGAGRDNEHVFRACQTLVNAYGHVCSRLADNIETFVDYGDARYIRSLLMLLYNSIMELRVTLSSLGTEVAQHRYPKKGSIDDGHTLRPHFRGPSEPPAIDLPPLPRTRNKSTSNGSNLRVATDMPLPQLHGHSRTPMSSSATPRSGESFSSIRAAGTDFPEDDAQFDQVFLSLQRSADLVLRTLPNFNIQLSGGLKNAVQSRAPAGLIQDWRGLITMCSKTIQQTEIMKNRLSLVKLKDPGVPSQASFWNLCSSFIASWTTTAHRIKQASTNKDIPLPPDTRIRLRPIQQSMKETSSVIANSPWHHLLVPTSTGRNIEDAANHVTSPTQVPITPQSAALGPAVQVALPTPQNGSFAAAFHGNVFDRADALMANPGISMSRGGTMVKGHSGFNSLSSISSLSSSDLNGGPGPTTNPNAGLGLAPLRLNGGKSVF